MRETTLPMKFVHLAYNEENCQKALKQLFLHNPTHYGTYPSLKEQT